MPDTKEPVLTVGQLVALVDPNTREFTGARLFVAQEELPGHYRLCVHIDDDSSRVSGLYSRWMLVPVR